MKSNTPVTPPPGSANNRRQTVYADALPLRLTPSFREKKLFILFPNDYMAEASRWTDDQR
jgi:hypothetical protein